LPRSEAALSLWVIALLRIRSTEDKRPGVKFPCP
jgi:hypothetical protein